LAIGASSSGATAPTSDETPAGDTARGFEVQRNGNALDATARAERDRRDKAITTTTGARAALAGFELHVIAKDDGAAFVLSKWELTRELPDLAAVSAFLDRAEANHA
jgi:hypothetical protein